MQGPDIILSYSRPTLNSGYFRNVQKVEVLHLHSLDNITAKHISNILWLYVRELFFETCFDDTLKRHQDHERMKIHGP